MIQTITSNHYWLTNAHIPICLLTEVVDDVVVNRDNVAIFDLEISDGKITRIIPAGRLNFNDVIYEEITVIDLKRSMVWPGFTDIHTHLDKGHICERTPNPDGTFASALEYNRLDRANYWNTEELYRRFEFGLKCSYAHGTVAIRTHIDCPPEQVEVSFNIFKSLQASWRDRLTLQASSLVTLDLYEGKTGEALADRVAEIGGVLGGVARMNPHIDEQLERIFVLAKERSLYLDFHTDENDNSTSITLLKVAETALRHDYLHRVVCGHCCSLSVQEPALVEKTLALVKQAGIGIVSLPMCNLYLQDRQEKRTPRWRGVTLLHELHTAGIPVAIASDNCRDPFYGYGDHDGLEVFNTAVRIAHLDKPYGNWPQAITSTSANLMQLPHVSRIGVGLPADLIIFKARYFSELLARPQSDRTVLRNGKPIDTTLPDYEELDDLAFGS